MKKIFIADPVDEACINIFTNAGIGVTYSTGNTIGSLAEKIKGFNALVVRSSTMVTTSLIEVMDTVEIIGRAGAGVDNIDVRAATRKGIVVMNTPGGNTISACEHTIAMLLAMCRKIPQANSSLKNGEWSRNKFQGTELLGKTLGLIGLGKIGKEVALRAKAFGMKVIAFDPIISDDAVSETGIQLVELEDIWRFSDFITVHTPLNEKTRNLISYNELSLCRKGVGLINCARGGIVNENDLLKALDEGIVSSAALDVFEKEPPDFSNKLLKHPLVICTPHLGASTTEAQQKVAIQLAEQMVNYFKEGTVLGAVNAFVLNKDISENTRPFVTLAETMGKFLSQLRTGTLVKLAINLKGDDLLSSGKLLSTALLKGFLSEELDSLVNYVNAPLIADEMGIILEETFSTEHKDYYNLIVATLITDSESFELWGTVFSSDDLRILKFNNYPVEFKPVGDIIIYKNIDKPGMLAAVSRILSDAEINIANLALGRIQEKNDALTVINIDSSIDDKVKESITAINGIINLYVVKLDF